MPLHIVRNDIARMNCDAIINAANTELRRGGGVCGAIFARADAEALEEACHALRPCPTGSAVLTEGYGLSCKYIIHAVGPIWQGGQHGEVELLRSTYRSALKIIEETGCRSAAFPLISAGIYGFPLEQALDIAAEALQTYLQSHEAELYLVIYGKESMLSGKKRFSDIQSFIDDQYVHSHRSPRFAARAENAILSDAVECSCAPEVCCSPCCVSSLEELLNEKAESFSEMVLRVIREKALDEVAVYKAANLDRKLFSRLRSKADYQPSKNTALALSVGLKLSLSDTRKLLEKAGYALSPSSRQDIIVEYFIRRKEYNIMTINEALFDFNEHLLGV